MSSGRVAAERSTCVVAAGALVAVAPSAKCQGQLPDALGDDVGVPLHDVREIGQVTLRAPRLSRRRACTSKLISVMIFSPARLQVRGTLVMLRDHVDRGRVACCSPG
jgi:hypothetical protein